MVKASPRAPNILWIAGPFHALWLIVFLFAAGLVVADAQSIVGTVQTSAGVPVQGVFIQATRANPFLLTGGSTDSTGTYSIGSNLSGNFSVIPNKTGYSFSPGGANVALTSGGTNAVANFTAAASLPVASTQSASNILASSASLRASVNPDGAATTVWFEYGPTTAYGNISATAGLGSGSSAVPVSIPVSNLLNQTSYHFRIYGSNSFGVVFGSDQMFTTLSGSPVATLLDTSAGGIGTMRLNAIADSGGSSATAWFEWGLTSSYGNASAQQLIAAAAAPANVSQVLTGLGIAATYHYRAVVTTKYGTNYTTDAFFTPAFYDIGAGLPGVSGASDFGLTEPQGHSSVAWGDYDNDGRLDILLAGNGTCQIWRNTGSGFTNVGVTLPTPLNAASVAWGDYDNDGRLDILLATATGLQICRNTGNGFTNINAGLPGAQDTAIAWGDYDNYGLDIVLTGRTNIYGALAQIWHNNGTNFVPAFDLDLPAFGGNVAWGDYDNDGRLDILLNGIVLPGPGVSPLSRTPIYRNNGSGFDLSAMLPGVQFGAAAWGDYDNDGLLDILLTGWRTNTFLGPKLIAEVWRNTGINTNGPFGVFSSADFGLPGIDCSAVAWGDYDNDGFLDILLCGTTNHLPSGAVTEIWRNTGNGFVNINAGLPGVSRGSVAWGDFDGDGRLDILLSGLDVTSNKLTQVWRNNLPVSNSPPNAPEGLLVTATNGIALLTWQPSSDNQTPSAALSYNVRIGTAPGGSNVRAVPAATDGTRRVPQFLNASQTSAFQFSYQIDTPYYWSVQAVDSAFAGSHFSTEGNFRVLQPVTPTFVVPAATTKIAAGDFNGDGIVDQNELNTVLSNYFPTSPWLYMTNIAGLGSTNVQFSLTNFSAWDLSVLVSTNLSDWDFLGPAQLLYQFTDPTNSPTRYYRLRWP